MIEEVCHILVIKDMDIDGLEAGAVLVRPMSTHRGTTFT
jgi:single-stranded DNA-specific DHH superfamily exonuclease